MREYIAAMDKVCEQFAGSAAPEEKRIEGAFAAFRKFITDPAAGEVHGALGIYDSQTSACKTALIGQIDRIVDVLQKVRKRVLCTSEEKWAQKSARDAKAMEERAQGLAAAAEQRRKNDEARMREAEAWKAAEETRLAVNRQRREADRERARKEDEASRTKREADARERRELSSKERAEGEKREEEEEKQRLAERAARMDAMSAKTREASEALSRMAGEHAQASLEAVESDRKHQERSDRKHQEAKARSDEAYHKLQYILKGAPAEKEQPRMRREKMVPGVEGASFPEYPGPLNNEEPPVKMAAPAPAEKAPAPGEKTPKKTPTPEKKTPKRARRKGGHANNEGHSSDQDSSASHMSDVEPQKDGEEDTGPASRPGAAGANGPQNAADPGKRTNGWIIALIFGGVMVSLGSMAFLFCRS